MADLHFELVTPERLVRSETVFMVVVPGSEGDFGVLAGHAPYMSTLRNGDIAIYRTGFGDTPERIPIEGGFAEVNDRGLTVLAERADAEEAAG
ncbi:MAG: F-type H+-transporting ATPase subunit epsilon [Sphingomonadales bacterium]|jgi:F-type H+-transporting ATPase subunit epsilon|nr:F-type H+-transporting ATPase subunit epsilon [Sphingomonadales bacterium]